MSEEKSQKKEKNARDDGSHLYVESIKEGPISAMDPKSKMRIDLFKGLNKVKKEVWDACKGLPMIEAYLKGGTLKERADMRCLAPKGAASPEAMEKAVDDKKARDEKAMKEKAEADAKAKAEADAKAKAEAKAEDDKSKEVKADEKAE